MLKNLDPILSPELLMVLAAMGHGDEVAIVDANYPAVTMARRLVRLDAVGATRVLEAVLSLLPLDEFVESPVAVMQVVGEPDTVPETVREFQQAVDRAEAKRIKITAIERFDFYERSRAAFAIVVTGETRLYGNVLLKKGVIRP
ncbi:MAG: RbsD/FucU family protein [Bryobacteraceae bacterium]|jgi:L-fucose mutarotase